ncbi:MAG: cobalamin B12-binding domain-containing protein [Theionarchaea archaeon]|nr:MAG: hypothetical protein AYK18_03760 [Theionarchaea archaeon DG-70]MBU7010291.1 cobalamin B12-binding domain-containing protein [Theionarchaea archaeon]
MKYDMLFIHPSAHTFTPQFIMMPMGIFSLAGQLSDYNVKAVNIGLEMCLDKTFRLEQFLKQYEFDRVGIDLHWHEHAYTSIETARLCKRINPTCSVILGGFTASYFAEEILHAYDFVDIVIAGEAEDALIALLQNKELSSVPNLVYRENNRIKRTPVTPVSSLDTVNCAGLTKMHHWEEYLKCSIHGYTKTRFWHDFWLCTGRGCDYNCSYCGGSSDAQKRICGREKMTFRSPEAVVRDLAYLQNLGVHVVCPSHDIGLAGEKYWKKLFALMKKEQIYMGMYLEVWQLPDKRFIEALADVCDPKFTTMVITLLSGSETVRRKNGKYFSNQDFYKRVHLIEKLHMNHAPYFATGLPFETVETFDKTISMTEKFLSQFNPCAIFCTPLRLDPGSPMYEDPAHYNIEKHYQSFTDYYIKCKKRAENSPYDALGYHTEFLDGAAIFTLQQKWEAILRNHRVMAADLLHFV